MKLNYKPEEFKPVNTEDFKIKTSELVNAVMSSKRRYVFRHHAVPVLKRLLTRYEEEEVSDAMPTKRLNEVLDRYVEVYQQEYRKGDEGIALFLRTVAQEYCGSVDTQHYFINLFLDLVSECFKQINQWNTNTIRYYNFAVEENNSHAVVNIELV